jgi:hypothetical protein
MITWLKEVFTNERVVPEITPEPEAVVKDIGEPVLSFVQCVKDNPKRFKLYTLETINNNPCFKLKDSLYDQEFSFCLNYNAYYPCTPLCDISASFLTSDERTYLVDNLRTVFIDKYYKRNKLLKIRADRVKDKEREAMKKIYCEGEIINK